MKTGANFIEQNQINRMFEQGETAKAISTLLNIKLAHIETYKPKKKKSVKKAVASNG